MNFSNSQKLFEMAQKHIVGGVNSPVRAFKSVGGTPLFITRAKESRIWDADGNEYIDYVGSWGPMILGHAALPVLKAVNEALKSGLSFGASHAKEIQLAQLVQEAYPSVDLLRFVNSGTEATMSALRLARAFTHRSKTIKFDGCYHGHVDSLLVKAGSGAQTLGQPDSAGVPPEFTQHTLIARFNDIDSVKNLFSKYKNQIAAVIVEPVVGNMGCIPPQPGFLQDLRNITKQEGALLLFDEVMTGFRLSFGGAQELYHITPDLTCFGKIIGGGLPVGAYGGRRDIMEYVAPLGPVYQAGTLSGNPLAMAAGIATLTELKKKDFYKNLEEKGKFLEEGINKIASQKNLSLQVNRVGSMLTCFFTEGLVTDADLARKADAKKFAAFFHQLLNAGINWAPSQFEAVFISATHSQQDLQDTLIAFEKAL